MSITEWAHELAPVREEQAAAISAAEAALPVLITVMRADNHESEMVRRLLASLIEGIHEDVRRIQAHLEWPTRKAVCAVFLAYRCERAEFGKFFDAEAILQAIEEAGLLGWFNEGVVCG